MHPEVLSKEAGACPKCGMVLEPIVPIMEERVDVEFHDMNLRFWFSILLTLPLIIGEMSRKFENGWIQLLLAAPVVLWGGGPFFKRGWASLVHRRLNMFTLISMGTGAATLYSVAALLKPGIFSSALYFEAAAVITTLVLLGQLLELRARRQASSSIKAMLGLFSKTARRLKEDGTDEEVPLGEIKPGDRLRGGRERRCRPTAWSWRDRVLWTSP